ncbi:hypothetical protein QS306_17080 [Paraburkholderia bonniea]|uniref:hypothetical protein n=1 Tax=Paraburkholderia bonniea TaxID=2152891 RepID=UPI00257373DA|nr:hypothetical protein [Paraburkholderia bonniea]WJF91784.1 hypothetical protein QS306_17080 [Paraburkholderia bonniea]WJF95104.1 hypothetical protein QS308_17085 [Paraburkholderia bonniea]
MPSWSPETDPPVPGKPQASFDEISPSAPGAHEALFPEREIDERQGTLMGFELPEGVSQALPGDTHASASASDPVLALAPAEAQPAALAEPTPELVLAPAPAAEAMAAEANPVLAAEPLNRPSAASRKAPAPRVATTAKVATGKPDPASAEASSKRQARRAQPVDGTSAAAAGAPLWSTLHASSPFALSPTTSRASADASEVAASAYSVRALSGQLQRLKWLLVALAAVLLIVLVTVLMQALQLARLTRESLAHQQRLTQMVEAQQAALGEINTTLASVAARVTPAVRGTSGQTLKPASRRAAKVPLQSARKARATSTR